MQIITHVTQFLHPGRGTWVLRAAFGRDDDGAGKFSAGPAGEWLVVENGGVDHAALGAGMRTDRRDEQSVRAGGPAE